MTRGKKKQRTQKNKHKQKKVHTLSWKFLKLDSNDEGQPTTLFFCSSHKTTTQQPIKQMEDCWHPTKDYNF